jgi:hypothetical protein
MRPSHPPSRRRARAPVDDDPARAARFRRDGRVSWRVCVTLNFLRKLYWENTIKEISLRKYYQKYFSFF